MDNWECLFCEYEGPPDELRTHLMKNHMKEMEESEDFPDMGCGCG